MAGLGAVGWPTLRVCFADVTGWTAPPIIAAIDAAVDLELGRVWQPEPAVSLAELRGPAVASTEEKAVDRATGIVLDGLGVHR